MIRTRTIPKLTYLIEVPSQRLDFRALMFDNFPHCCEEGADHGTRE